MKSFGESEPDNQQRGMIASYEESIADMVAFAKTVKGKIYPLVGPVQPVHASCMAPKLFTSSGPWHLIT